VEPLGGVRLGFGSQSNGAVMLDILFVAAGVGLFAAFGLYAVLLRRV
jgi:hypothetical protein